jgi:phosphoribosylformylglycinamidine (FGAM) synthase PurS component
VVSISLGNNSESISSSVTCVKRENLKGYNQCVLDDDKISLVFDKEEKEEKEREEVDKLILNFLCNEIMEEIMVPLIRWVAMLLRDTNHLPLQKSAKHQEVNQRISVQNKRNFLE